MNIQIVLNLAGIPDDSSLEEVARVMRCCVCANGLTWIGTRKI